MVLPRASASVLPSSVTCIRDASAYERNHTPHEDGCIRGFVLAVFLWENIRQKFPEKVTELQAIRSQSFSVISPCGWLVLLGINSRMKCKVNIKNHVWIKLRSLVDKVSPWHELSYKVIHDTSGSVPLRGTLTLGRFLLIRGRDKQKLDIHHNTLTSKETRN